MKIPTYIASGLRTKNTTKPNLSRNDGTKQEILKIVASLGISGGVALQFLGHISHETYLRKLGIDSSLFSKSVYWTEVNGYYTLFDRLSAVTLAFTENWKSLIFLAAFIAIYMCSLLLISRSTKIKNLRDKINRKDQVGVAFFFPILLTVFVITFMPIALIIFTLVIAAPGLIGESGGRIVAEQDFIAFQKGCLEPATGYFCIEVRNANVLISKGFLIDSSSTHIAIYDVGQDSVRTIERKGTEIISDTKKLFSKKQ